MIIALTGISSGLAKAMVPRLQSDPDVERIIGIDVNAYPGKSDKITFVKADIRNSAQLESAFENADVLIHMAFIVVPKKMPALETIYDININGSKTVFKAAAKKKIKKILYLSSLSAYGHQPQSPKSVTEDSPMLGVKTTNFYYSYSKGMVEQFLDQFEKENPEIAIIRVRPPIIGSPDDLLKEFKAIGKGKPFSRSLFPLNHNGKKPMQLLHQDDLVDILMLMLKKDVRGAYNVASEPLQDMSVFFKKECNHELKPAFHAVHNLILALHKKWPQLGWIQGWKYSSILNTEKVEKEFNWKPKHTTEELMKTSLQSILKSRKQ